MRRHPWLVVSLLALLGVVVLGAFPAKAYLDQLDQRRELAGRIRSLATESQRLADESARLQSDEVIERLARERYQLVRPGEEAYAILPEAAPVAAPPPATPAPATTGRGWWSRAWAKLTSLP